MANTVVEVECHPGTLLAYLTTLGGSGAPATSYALTQVAGYVHTITIPEALTGRWYIACGDTAGRFGYRDVELVDEATTIELPSVDAVLAAVGGDGIYTLTVTVQDGDSNAVQGARVTIQGTDYHQTSDSNGQVVFNVDAGTYTLVTSPPTGYDTPANVVKAVSGNDTATVTLTATIPESSGVGWLP